jgi:hypothetical protein
MTMSSFVHNIRTFAIFLLLFNGLNAIVAGWLLMTDPTGNVLRMSPGLLEYSPFTNFLIPGIVLFVANGLVSLMIALAAARKWKYFEQLISIQGSILTGWIIIQAIMLQTVNFLHLLFGAIGILLCVFGIVLKSAIVKDQMSRRKNIFYH